MAVHSTISPGRSESPGSFTRIERRMRDATACARRCDPRVGHPPASWKPPNSSDELVHDRQVIDAIVSNMLITLMLLFGERVDQPTAKYSCKCL
jgi:hypothetical protein